MFARLIMFMFVVFVAHSALASSNEDHNPFIPFDRKMESGHKDNIR